MSETPTRQFYQIYMEKVKKAYESFPLSQFPFISNFFQIPIKILQKAIDKMKLEDLFDFLNES